MIIPAEVKGFFHRRRQYVHFLLLLFFLGLPWIQIHGHQLVLLNISKRRFEILGQVFMSHDSPLLFFLVAILILAISLTTALWGRVWCGWACPQTVFLDAVYRRLELWVMGNYIQRRRLRDAPMSFEKFWKSSAKWFLFFLFSSLFAHSFVAYFSGSQRLLQMMTGSPAENQTYFWIVSGMTALVMFNFGWFREQFCIIMCPYGRFQTVLMDSQSFTVVYDQKRGEPRKEMRDDPLLRGDCVSCQRCVQVCPTGIDIRNGLQMECIGCTACIDACDEIMEKVHKPAGLISYRTSVPHQEVRYLRPRILTYLVLLLLLSSGLIWTLANRQAFAVAILRGTDAPYQLSQDKMVINHFKLNLHNQSHENQNFEISIPPEAWDWKIIQSAERHEFLPGESKEIHLFLSFPAKSLDRSGKMQLKLKVRELKSGEERWIEFPGVGPAS